MGTSFATVTDSYCKPILLPYIIWRVQFSQNHLPHITQNTWNWALHKIYSVSAMALDNAIV